MFKKNRISGVLPALRAIAGAENVRTDEAEILMYSYDAGMAKARPEVVINFTATEQVAPAVRALYAAGIPFAYLPRPRFREYPVLADFIEHKIGGFAVSLDDYTQGAWIDRLRDLLQGQPRQPHPENGATQVADFILQGPQCSPPVQPPSGSPQH